MPNPSGPDTQRVNSLDVRSLRKLYVVVALLAALLIGLVAGIFAYAGGRESPYGAVATGAAATVTVFGLCVVVLEFLK